MGTGRENTIQACRRTAKWERRQCVSRDIDWRYDVLWWWGERGRGRERLMPITKGESGKINCLNLTNYLLPT